MAPKESLKPMGTRLVDRETGVRTRPMKVLALGQARTGTSSLRDALQMVGYKPFHFSGMIVDWEHQVPLWTEAIQAKFSPDQKTYGREEFDKMIGDYDCVEDNPGILFAEELIKAYPDAKVILTNRDMDAWAKSMFKTVFKNKHNLAFKYIAPMFPFAGAWWKILNLIIDHEYAGGEDMVKVKQAYIDHYALVRRLVPKENLLELHFGDGWEPVCKFLDIPTPDVPWPHSNEGDGFNARSDFFGLRIVLVASFVIGMTGLIGWQLPLAYSRYSQARVGTHLVGASLVGGVFWPWVYNSIKTYRASYLVDNTLAMS